MKKLIVLIILVVTVVSCTERDIELWNEVQKERGYDCYTDTRSGDFHCGYLR